jgi:tetratricopeptide (TPR) repeat protein
MMFLHRFAARSAMFACGAACLLLTARAEEATQVPATEGEATPSTPAAVAEETPDGDQPGQPLLNDAINAKLEIDEIDDFGRVLDLCKKALEKGLDADSKKFAEDLYTGTLIDRAAMLSAAILDADEPDQQWRRIRSFAMRDLNEVVARDPRFGSVHLMIARLEALPGGNRARAAAAATKALELLGDDQLQKAQANLVLASLDDDPEKQLRFLDAAVELSPRDADVRRARGMHLLMQDEYEKAREDLAVAVEEEPEDPSLLEALGMACMMSEQMEDARKAFDRAIELDPEAAGPLLQRARVYAVGGDQDKALADIDRAIDLAPRDQAARLLRARIQQQAGNTEAALADIDRAIDLAPRDQAARLLRARIQQQAGNTEAALADIEAVLEQDADMPAALELKGLIAAEREDYPEAIRCFRKLVAKNPDDAVVLSQLGTLFLAAKQPREAIRRFTKALEIDADNFPSRRGRSDAEISIGDHVAAIADLEKAYALKPDDTGILNNLAWLLATSPNDDIRDADRAIELATKACEATEWKEPHIVSTLAAGYAEKGDFETARKYSQQAVDDEELADEVKDQLRGELASYEAGKPWRERQEVAEGGDAVPRPEAGLKPEKEKPAATASRERKPRRPFDE